MTEEDKEYFNMLVLKEKALDVVEATIEVMVKLEPDSPGTSMYNSFKELGGEHTAKLKMMEFMLDDFKRRLDSEQS